MPGFFPHIPSYMYMVWSRRCTELLKVPRKITIHVTVLSKLLFALEGVRVSMLQLCIWRWRRPVSAYSYMLSKSSSPKNTSEEHSCTIWPPRVLSQAHLCLRKLKWLCLQTICQVKIVFYSHGIPFSDANWIFNEIFYFSLPKYYPQNILKGQKGISYSDTSIFCSSDCTFPLRS